MALSIERGDFVHDRLRSAMCDFLAAIWILHGKVEGCLVNSLRIHAPAFGRVGGSFLQLHELGEVVIVQRIGFAEVASGVELIVPDSASRGPFFEEKNDRLHAGTLEGAARA